MAIMKVLRKIVAGSVISCMVFSSILCYSPFLPQALALPVEHKSFSSVPFLLTLRSQNNASYEQANSNSEEETQINNDIKQTDLLNNNDEETNLSQEEIDKIVEDHLQSQQKTEQTLKNTIVDQEDLGITKPENLKIDRFIVKYKSENQKEETVNKVKGNLKERKLTKNKKFDIYFTAERMKKEDFQALIKQKNADNNIEYIQPDYQVTVASSELPQSEEKPPATNTDQTTELSVTETKTDTEAPQLSKIIFDGLKIQLTYDEILNNGLVPTDNDFVLKSKDSEKIEFSGLEIIEDSLVITLRDPIAAGESITVSYTPGTNPLQDQAGNLSEGFAEKQVESSLADTAKPQEPIVDNTVPTLVTAKGKENIITLQYNDELDTTSIPDIEDFILDCQDETGNPVLNAIENVTIQDQEVSLALKDNLTTGQAIQLSYISGKTPLKDLAGNSVGGFDNKAIVILSETLDSIAPVLQTASINADLLELSFDEQLKVDSLPEKEDFCLSLNDNSMLQAIKSFTIDGNKVILTITAPVSASDTVSISYTPGETPLMDLAGNNVKDATSILIDNITSPIIDESSFADQWAMLSNKIDAITKKVISVGVDAIKAWTTSEGDGVIVAVIDTGIDITHEALKDNIWINTAEISGNDLDEDGNSYVDDVHGWNFVDRTNSVHSMDNVSDEWHGTHVAGIIAASMNTSTGIVGVAPKAKIMPLQVFKNGTAYTSDIISAIDYAKENGAQVVNCSWGTSSENIALNEAMTESGLLFICAAGNSNKDIDANPVYPASLTADNIISVASINKTGNLSRFSNYGLNSVDVAAPGEEIISTTPGNTYGQSGGTSQAAAFVTGEAALLLSKYPEASLSEIKTRIIHSSDKLSSLTGKVAGGGKINCASALTDPVTISDNVIQILADQTQDAGTGTPDSGNYDLYSMDEWNTFGRMQTARMNFGAVTFNDKIYSIGGSNNGSCLSSVEIFDPLSGTSTLASSLKTPRYVLGATVAGGKVYAIGGYNGGDLNTVEEYDPSTNTWTTKASMPTARSFLGVAAVNGKIYAIGGSTNTGLVNTVEEYNPATNTWSAKASMITARSALSVIAVNDKIYAIGGCADWHSLNKVEEYNPAADTWTTKSNMPTSKQVFGVTAINGKIYAVGGYNNGSLSNVYEYDPVADVWARKADLATPRYGLGVAVAVGKIYALGGYNGDYLKSVEAYGLSSKKWQTISYLPTKRAELGAAAVNGIVYAIGGYNGSTYQNTVEAYDKATNSWLSKQNMPTARTGLGVSATNGKIYAIGGFNGSYLNTVEEYDSTTNTWTTKLNMPTARRYLGLTEANGKLYAVGGYNGTSPLNILQVYDPTTNTWISKANMPTARWSLGVVAANGKIYAIGGYNGTSYCNAVEEYDPVSNTWSTKASMPTARKGLGLEISNGKIYAVGGYNNTGFLNTVEKYDPVSNSWTALNKESLFASRERFGSTSLDGKLYVIGGYNGAYCNTVEEYGPTLSSWNVKANLQTGRAYLGVAAVKGKIYAIGGDNGDLKNTVEEYDQSSNTWTTKASMLTARSNLGVAVVNDKIYAIGGFSDAATNIVEEYDPETNSWSSKADMPTGRIGLGVATLNGKIYAIGGSSNGSLNTVEEYNPITDTWVTKANMLTARSSFGIATMSGKIFVFGGYGSNVNDYVNTVEVYDPANDTWSSKNNSDTQRYGLTAITASGKIYVVGGFNNNGFLNTAEEYDPTKDSWATGASMPTARANLALAEVKGSLYAIGGYNGSSLNSVEEYNLGVSTWNTAASMTTARSYLGTAIANGKLYAVGGYNNSFKNTTEEYNPDTNLWASKANMPTARRELGVVSSNNEIYAIGGYNGSYLKNVETFNPLTNAWSTKASMSTARKQPGVAAVNGKIYAIGGNNGSDLNTVEMYDPATNSWIAKANMPTARYGMGISVVDGKIYVMGGYSNQSLKTVEVYDPGTNTWSVKTSMPTARTGLSTGVVNNLIYALGGVNGVTYLDANEEYDPDNDSWIARSAMMTSRAGLGVSSFEGKIYTIGGIRLESTIKHLPTVEVYDPTIESYSVKESNAIARSSLSVTEANGNIYAIGGYDGSTYLNTVEKYNGSWHTMEPMPTARRDLGLAFVNGKLYALGGYNGSYLNTVEEYDPLTDTWVSKASMLTARSGLGVTVVNGMIYAIGGYNSSGNQNTTEAYNPTTNTWVAKANMPTARTNLGVVNLNSLIYAIGGKGSISLGSAEIYDPVSNIWTTGANMPTPRHGLGVAVVNGKIYAIGGYDGNNYLSIAEEYDPTRNTWGSKTNALIPRAYFGAATLGNTIYLVDGCNNSGNLNSAEAYSMGDVYLSTLAHLGEGVVNLSGNFSRTYTDAEFTTPGFTLNITRTYNSRDDREDGPLGKGWSFALQGSLANYLTNQIMARLPNGSAITFTKNADNSYTANDSRSTLVKQADNSYILTTKDQYSYGFTASGWLTWMKDRNGNTITLTVNSTTGKITRATDQVGRQINITYNTKGYMDTITDPLGRTVQYKYDSNNRLIQVIDPTGRTKNYSYNSEGFLKEIRDHDNNLIESVTYDTSIGVPNIRIASLTDAFGNTSTYMYDNEVRKLTVTDLNNQKTITWYDSSLYPVEVQDPDGRISKSIYSLDANNVNNYGEALSRTDRNGNKTVYQRDNKGNITRIYNPDSSYHDYGYDSKNNVIWEEDENSKYTFFVYDTNINLVKKAQPLNGTDQYTTGCDESKFAVTNYVYYTNTQAQQLFGCNVSGLLNSESDPNGYLTTYTYDNYGNIKTVTDAESKKTTYSYNSISWKTGVVSAKGYNTSYVYDKNGNLVKTTHHGGEVARTTHDNMGRPTKVIAANLYNPALDNLANDTYSGDQGTRYTYYPSGKIKTQTDAAGNTTTYTYDLYGNVLTETRPNDSVIQYSYDNLNRIASVKFKDNSAAAPVLLQSISYLNLANGNTQKIETKYLNDTETAITTYTYDYKGRLIRQDNPDGTHKTTSYNLNGTVNDTNDERGYGTYFRYDGLNRNNEQWVPTATDASGNTLYTYTNTTYDKAGNALSVKTGKTAVGQYQVPTNFITRTKTYYNNNKLKSETDSAGRRTDYFYDNDGNISQKDVYTSATTKNVTEYVNNYFGKPVTEKLHVRKGDIFGNSFTDNTDIVLTTTNTYDKNGNILTVTRPDNVAITYTYDNLDRQTSMSMPGKDEHGNPVTITSSTTYDWAGKVLTQTDANNHTITYSYDQRERLVKVTDILGHSAANYYDLAGRLIAEVTPNNYDPNKALTQMSRTEYTYDNMDRVKTKGYTYLDPKSGQWETFVAKAYKYDANGNMIKELDALGYEAGTGSIVDDKINSGYGTLYTYDPANRVLTVLDPVSRDRGLPYTAQYAYDGAGRKISETNANGVVTFYSYDDANNLLTTKVNNQTVKTNTYDTVGNPITQTDGNGNTITLGYNAWNKVKQAVYPNDATIPASTVTYQYDASGNLKQTTNSAGPVDSYTYDNQGRELSHIQQKADGTQSISTSVRYDKVGNKRFLVDGNNVVTENMYNEINKLTSSKQMVTNANSVSVLHVTSYGYDADGNQTSQTDWLGNTYSNTYDPLNRLIEKKNPLNKSIEKMEYNHNSVQIRSTDALNKVTQYTYDKNNRLLSTIDPLNHTKSKTYDNVGNVVTTTDGRGKVTINHYDQFNRLTSVVNAKNETTSYTYDLNGNKLTQTDGANHTTTYEYNVANKLKRKIDHGGRTGTYPNYAYDSAKTESYYYDAKGILLSKLDRNGNTTTYTYDVHCRMLSQTNGTQTVTYTYDGNGNQLTMTDSTGTTTRIYDELNRTKSKAVPGVTGTMTFLYDISNGLPSGQVAETDTDQKGNVTTKVFDQAGRMISVTAGGNTTTYTYYDNGSKHRVVYPDGSSEEYTYYENGLLHTLVNKKADQAVIDSYAYTYDATYNQTSKVDAKGTTTYTYDNLNRLESVTEPSGKLTTYTFDEAGNRSTQSETIGTTVTVTSYTYNEQNRLTNTLTKQNNVTTQTVAYTYDNNGNQLTVATVPYVDGVPQTAQLITSTYNVFNQLTVTTTPEGTSITNTYNGEGLRVVKQVNSQITKYIYESDKVVLELDGTGNQTARNIQGTSLISRTVDGTTLYYMYNGHADVTALLDVAGTIQATYYYDAFGNIMETTGNVNNPFTYAGYQYDKESNYYYLNARFYDPVTARFLSEDTFTGNKNDPLSLNLYTYCHNEPIMYSDPTGHSWLSTIISVGKSIVRAIGSASKSNKGKSNSSSKGSSSGNGNSDSPNNSTTGNSGFLSNVVNTISSMLFGNNQSLDNTTVQRPSPSSQISKLVSDINHMVNFGLAYYDTQGTREAYSIQSRPTLSEHRDHVLNQLNYDLLEYKRSIGLVDDGGTPHLTDAEVEYNKEMSGIIVYGNVGMLGGAALESAGKLIAPIYGKIGSFLGKGAAIPETTRVGQWMSKSEYEQFIKTGKIPRTNVLTNGKEGYIKQANVGDYYAEFDINSSLLQVKDENLGWSLVKSMNQSYLKLAEMRGETLPEPIGTNIIHVTTK